MTRITGLSALHLLLLGFAFYLGFQAEPASAQTAPPIPPGCAADPRFVRLLGDWQGQPVCELTGAGMGEANGVPISTAKCLADHSQVVVFNGYRYCVWYHNGTQALIAAILYDPGTAPIPPDNILFPTPLRPAENPNDPSHCTKDPNFLRILGQWRGVTLCQWSDSRLPNSPKRIGDPLPETSCPSPSYPIGRVRVFPDDFANPPSASSIPPPDPPPPPDGTRFCVFAVGRWDTIGIRAIIVAQQPSQFDLGIDTHLVRRLQPGGGPATLTIWIGSTQPIPAGAELIVQGSLTPAHYFGPMMPAMQGWLCTGSWSAFSCHKILSAPLAGPQTLELPAIYPPGFSGQNVTYSASVTMTNNRDPTPANNLMTTNTTLY